MSTITKEQLRERARAKVKSLELAVTQTAFADSRADLEEELELARIALASLEAEPVCVIDQSNLDYLKSGSDADVWPASRTEMGDVLLYRSAPPAPVVPAELHPDTQKLVTDFCTALAEKLYKAQLKYGYDADWKQDGWPTQCQAHFHQHIAKGDPRDVAAYCAFMWYHGWKTEAVQPEPVSVPTFDEWLEIRGNKPLGWVKDAMRESYDACRAAMLQGAERVTTAYKLPPHIYRELVNRLRDTAVKYQGCQQLREQLSRTLQEVIQPAAPQQEVKP